MLTKIIHYTVENDEKNHHQAQLMRETTNSQTLEQMFPFLSTTQNSQ